MIRHPIKEVAKLGEWLFAIDTQANFYGLTTELTVAFQWQDVTQMSVQGGKLVVVRYGQAWHLQLDNFTVQPTDLPRVHKKLPHPKQSQLTLCLHDDGAIRAYNGEAQLGHSHKPNGGHWLSHQATKIKWLGWDQSSLRWAWAMEDAHGGSRITLMRPKEEGD